jgi:hypothetical protein
MVQGLRGRVPAPPETDTARIRKYCRARVPASFRNQIRVEAAVRGSSVSIYECRPPWHPDLTEWSKVRVAQLRYSADTHHWSLYYADRNGRWHRYDDLEPGPVGQLLCEIDLPLSRRDVRQDDTPSCERWRSLPVVAVSR